MLIAQLMTKKTKRADLTTQSGRLRWVRETFTKLRSAAEASRAMRINVQTYSGHENGSGGRPDLPRDAAIKYAKFYKVSLEWLLTGTGAPRPVEHVRVVGYLGAGAQIIPMDDYAQGGGLEEVEPPPGVVAPCVAARVRGNSMYPMMEEGWLVFWTKDQDGVPADCIGKNCVVKLMDGRMFVKRLRRGTSGKYTLESWNAPPIEDAELEWAAKIIGIVPT